MADTVSKKNNDHFTNQARLHQIVADYTRQMISQHKVIYGTLVEEAQGSRMSSAMQHYIDWWESFHPQLVNHADLHEKMAGHLNKSVSSFDETDTNIQHEFSDEYAGFSS